MGADGALDNSSYTERYFPRLVVHLPPEGGEPERERTTWKRIPVADGGFDARQQV